MVCGYPTSKDCVACSGLLKFGCVRSTWVLSSIGFSFARTSLCRRDGLFLYAITGGFWKFKIWLNVPLLWINFQCFLSI